MTNDYAAEWKTIDSLEKQGLPKSALEAVESLYTKVKEEGNAAQEIKCLLYRSKYQSQLEEDGLIKAIYRMQEEKDKAADLMEEHGDKLDKVTDKIPGEADDKLVDQARDMLKK